MYEIKNSKPVELSDRVRFRCKRCAECCRHVEGSVVIESLDAFRISKHLKIGIEEFYDKYTDMFILEDTIYPIFALKTTGKDKECIFLKGKRCTIQDAKPRTCRMYPFWIEPCGYGERDFKYNLSTEHTHHPKGSLIRVKDWMNKYFYEEDRKFLSEEYRTVTQIAPLLNTVQHLKKDQEDILKLILFYRYYNFNLDEPFLVHQHNNNTTLESALKYKIETLMK